MRATPPGEWVSSGPSTGADGGEHVGTAVRGRRRPSGTPEHGFVAHVDGVTPERSRQTGARGDSPTCGHRPHQGHHTTTRHLRSVHTGSGRTSACPTADTGRPRPTASVQERTTKDTGPGRTHHTTRTLVGCAVRRDAGTCPWSGLCVCAARPHRGGGGQGCAGGASLYIVVLTRRNSPGGQVWQVAVLVVVRYLLLAPLPWSCGRGRAPAGWLGLCGPGVPSQVTGGCPPTPHEGMAGARALGWVAGGGDW